MKQLDSSQSKTNLRFMLVNQNDVSPDQVHMDFIGDLAVTYYLIAPETESGMVMVTAEMVKAWGLNEDSLFALAKENSERYCPHNLRMLSSVDIGDLQDIYLLSNLGQLFGACTILYGDTLKNLSEKHDMDLCILPSSKHEVLLVPVEELSVYALESYRSHVYAVNRDIHVMEPEDVLSDILYYYDRKKDVVMPAEVAYESNLRWIFC